MGRVERYPGRYFYGEILFKPYNSNSNMERKSLLVLAIPLYMVYFGIKLLINMVPRILNVIERDSPLEIVVNLAFMCTTIFAAVFSVFIGILWADIGKQSLTNLLPRIFIDECVGWPVSRVLSPPRGAMDGHSSGTPVTGRLARPTRRAVRKHTLVQPETGCLLCHPAL